MRPSEASRQQGNTAPYSRWAKAPNLRTVEPNNTSGTDNVAAFAVTRGHADETEKDGTDEHGSGKRATNQKDKVGGQKIKELDSLSEGSIIERRPPRGHEATKTDTGGNGQDRKESRGEEVENLSNQSRE